MRRLSLVLSLLPLLACAPQLRVRPDSPQTVWENGLPVATGTGPSLGVRAVASSLQPNRLMLEVTVQNTSQHPLLLDSTHFRLSGSSTQGRLVSAVDPEVELREIRRQLAFLSSGLVLVAEAVSVSTEGSSEELDARREELGQQQHFWETQMLRRTTLEPGGMLRGLVAFGYPVRKGELSLQVDSEAGALVLPFRVEVDPSR